MNKEKARNSIPLAMKLTQKKITLHLSDNIFSL